MRRNIEKAIERKLAWQGMAIDILASKWYVDPSKVVKAFKEYHLEEENFLDWPDAKFEAWFNDQEEGTGVNLETFHKRRKMQDLGKYVDTFFHK